MNRKIPFMLLIFILLLTIVTSCGEKEKENKKIIIVNSENVVVKSVISNGKVPMFTSQDLSIPGTVLAFRATIQLPAPERTLNGQAGHVYQLNEHGELKEIGEFDVNVSDDSLLQKYGKTVE
jgi:hypothetical protein